MNTSPRDKAEARAPGFDQEVLQPFMRALSQGEQMVALFDSEDRLRHANAAFRSAYMQGGGGFPLFTDILRQAFLGRYGPKISDGDIEAFLAYVATRRRLCPQRAFEVDLLDGRWLWVSETLMEDGWLLLLGTDITALKHNERTLRRARDAALLASRTDPLTDLPNRRWIMELCADALALQPALGAPLSVALIDIDHFKRINDTLGHAGGDHVLVQFAATCHARLRRGDALGRFGGEEFLLLLPDCPAVAACGIVDDIRRYILSADTPRPPQLPHYTFSAGIASARPDDTVESLLRRADMALYAAKGAGRNRVEMAAP